MVGKDRVTNISTALMAINELASYYDIPINIHFNAKGSIYIHVGFGTPYRKEMSFYPQDTYRIHSETDDIYKWVEDTIETLAVRKVNPAKSPVIDDMFGVLDAFIRDEKTDAIRTIPSFDEE